MIIHPSQLPTMMDCPQSVRIQGTPVDDDMTAANLGSAVHYALAKMARWGDAPGFAGIAKHWGVDADEVEKLYNVGLPWLTRLIAQGQLGGMHTLVEKTLRREANFPETGRVGIVGTTDLLQLDEAKKRAFVPDWKTGWKDRDYYWQMAGYAALVFWNYAWCDEVTAMIGWLREGQMESYTFTRDEHLPMIQERITQALRSNNYVVGKQCLTCQRRHECDARNQVVRSTMKAMTPGEGDVVAELLDMDPEERGDWYNRVDITEQACKTMKQAFRKLVEDGEEVDIGNGMMLTLEPQTRREIIPLPAWDYLCDMFGPEVAGMVKIVNGKLDKAIGDKAKADGVTKKQLTKEVYNHLEHLKAIERHESMRLTETRKPNQEDDDGGILTGELREDSGKGESGGAEGAASPVGESQGSD